MNYQAGSPSTVSQFPSVRLYLCRMKPRANRGPGTSAGIADGQYRTPRGQGTIGGPHKVRISGYDGQVKPIPGAPGGQTMPAGPPLFENIELQVDLPRNDSTFDFHLPQR